MNVTVVAREGLDAGPRFLFPHAHGMIERAAEQIALAAAQLPHFPRMARQCCHVTIRLEIEHAYLAIIAANVQVIATHRDTQRACGLVFLRLFVADALDEAVMESD